MHVLILSIGPVQEFIETARKCRDLWFGSWLLSELARAAAAAVVAAEGRASAEVLVFPGADVSDRSRAVANKVVARIAGDPARLAAAAERAVRERLVEVRDRAFARVGHGDARRAELFHEGVACAQVDGLIEVVWAAAEESTAGYRAALDAAEGALGAAKNTKRWKQPSWARDGVPKSSLDGVRESVLDERLFPPPDRERARGGERLRRSFGVHGSERLCGVGLLKRFGSTEPATASEARPERIFSTSHVASAPFRAGLARLGAAQAWASFAADLDAVHRDLVADLDTVPAHGADPITGRVDGAVFYEGRLVEELEELEGEPPRERVEAARKALARFLRTVKPLGEPNPYYALLLADGDRMGAVIGAAASFEEHRRLSAELEAFASSARGVVADHEGALVYSGGDDVLALLPLHRALACATTLSRAFAERMRPWKQAETGESPTLSVGLAIVHHLVPLDEALAMVRDTEKRAKRVDGKNALAIRVKRRGGEAVEVTGTWGTVEHELDALVGLHRRGSVSAKAQYELMDLSVRTAAPHGATGETPEQRRTAALLGRVRAAEAERILARKQAAGGGAIAGDATAILRDHLSFDAPDRLGRALYVAQLIASAIDQAEGQLGTAKALRAEEVTP